MKKELYRLVEEKGYRLEYRYNTDKTVVKVSLTGEAVRYRNVGLVLHLKQLVHEHLDDKTVRDVDIRPSVEAVNDYIRNSSGVNVPLRIWLFLKFRFFVKPKHTVLGDHF